MTDNQKISNILKKREYFNLIFPAIERCDARQDIPYRLPNSCPSCGYLTLDTRCSWEICIFCFWEDDGQDNQEANKVYGGPNSNYSLTAYRLEAYDLMNKLKETKSADNPKEYAIGQELIKLDKYIANNEPKKQSVVSQIELLSKLFSKLRGIDGESKPNWKFLSNILFAIYY